MPIIKISKVSRQNVAHKEHLEWLQGHLNTWLPVLGVSFNKDGTLFSIDVDTEENPIVLFLYDRSHRSTAEYEVQGMTLNTPREFVMNCKMCSKERKVEMTEDDYKILQDNTVTQGLYVCPDCWEDLT